MCTAINDDKCFVSTLTSLVSRCVFTHVLSYSVCPRLCRYQDRCPILGETDGVQMDTTWPVHLKHDNTCNGLQRVHPTVVMKLTYCAPSSVSLPVWEKRLPFLTAASAPNGPPWIKMEAAHADCQGSISVCHEIVPIPCPVRVN